MMSEQIIIETEGIGNKKKCYIKRQKIGSGGFAKCYMLIDCETKQKFAAKVIDAKQIKDRVTQNKIIQEIQIHKQLEHPHIVKFYDTFQYQNQIYMVMELCQNNTLKQFIKNRVRITQFQAKFYLHQIIQGVQYLHNLNIIHRDIKLGNLFLNIKMEVKIGDFGLSKQLKQPKQKRFTTCGTPNYIAPQILKQTGHSFEADIWAIGIILYAMLIGKPPFESQSVEHTYRKIKNNSYDFPKQIPISQQARNLIKNILDPNPKTRITLEKMKKHDFLNKDLQKIPKSMPSYTISIPPQVNFLKMYVNQKNMKLLVYPKKVNDRYNYMTQLDQKASKLARVVSADKNTLLKLSSYSKQCSSLNRGRYLKIIRTQSMPKHSIKQLKGIRSGASLWSSASPKGKLLQSQKYFPKSPKTDDEDLNQIICYYDISDKYGTAYLLSNGNYGIIFNDRTSLTALQDPEKIQNTCYIYNDKKPEKFQQFPQNLQKKKQILKICKQKLDIYRKNNVLIPYHSEAYAKKFMKINEGFMIKLSNGIMQFFWAADSITLRNYRWVRWRINYLQGQGQLNQKNIPEFVKDKLQQVKSFLLKYSLNSKAKYVQKQ